MRKLISMGVFLLSYPFQSSAFFPNYLDWNFNATVGVDPGTLSVVQGLPEEIKEQTIALITEALPLLDKSVYGYLNRINEIITLQQTSLICTASAISATTLDQIVLKYPFLGQVTPLRDLETNWNKIEKKFTASTKSHDYLIEYADYIYRIGLVKCKLQIAPSANLIATQMLAQATSRWSVWVSLEKECGTAKDCLTKMYRKTDELIRSSDARDIKAVNAMADFSAVGIPQESFFSHKFDYRAYEIALLSLNNITSGITLAKIVREKKEQTERDELTLLARLDQTFISINNAYSSINQQFISNPDIVTLVKMRNSLNENIKTLANLTSSVNSSQASSVSPETIKSNLLGKTKTLSDNLNSLLSRVNDDIRFLHEIQDEEERRTREISVY
ncbi:MULTISPECIES: hypothetical protein [Klebsiella pneumoniae complex]|uniref:hypothetical protein n=1 Tax=Klebsiella pneumoniae complex TaxID=3390273 RepID=UPI000C7DA025|nr:MULTISPECIES: hypothetical protein [Klebsiella]PLI29005.1 hypothetical protein B6J44_11085 [Klebsiella pneumoniae]PLJ06940.1 hypothetical protein B6J59_28145 [Klebsiella pneumoniae]VFZ92571.1 Uncharacterised protein [Klebsiella pneumoniae]HBX9938283.1 hypothetical protein [Klebsiella variicola]